MEQPTLPLSYYCRSARLALKKADYARKAGLFVEELKNLRKFESLLLSTIPCHPNYHLNKGESQIADLQIILVDVEKRIKAMETDSHGRLSPYSNRRAGSKLKTSKSSVRPTRTSRLCSEAPKKVRKNIKKTTATKKREGWEDWSSRLSEAPRKRSLSPLSRKSPSRKSRSPSRSPLRKRPAGCKYWEAPPPARRLWTYDRDEETEREERWRFRSLGGTGTDRLRSLSRKLLATRFRDRESSRSPISRALQPLEDDFINMQAQLIEMKGSLDGLKLRFDEEGRVWRSRTENLDKDLQYLRHDMEVDMVAIKRSIQEEVKRTLDGLTNDLAAAEDLWALSEAQKKEKLQHVREESSAMMDDFREKMNFSFVETKAVLLKTMDEKIASTLGSIKSGLRSDFEILEMGIAREIDDLKREMTSRSECFLTEVELAGIGGKQKVESLIKEALEKFLPQKLDSMVGKERTVTEMKEALCLLWREVEALSKSKRGERDARRDECEELRRGPIRQAIDRCFPTKSDCSMDTRERSISEVKDELRSLWSEVDSLSRGRKDVLREGALDIGDIYEDNEQVKKLLQYVRKEAMQARVGVDDVKKECMVLKRSVGDIEIKLLHIEGVPQLLDNMEAAKTKVDTALSFIEKEKNLAISAATDAASAASKAGQMVEDVIGSVSSEKLNARRKSCEFQESLAMEKDMVAESAGAVLSEVRRKSMHLQESLEQDISKVKESFSTEVRRLSMDLNVEREYVASEARQFQRNLKDAFASLERERDAASSAASEITLLAERAEGLLAKMTKSKATAAELKGTGFETELDYSGNDDRASVRNLTILEARIKHTAGEQLNLSRKVHKLETVQATFFRTVEDLRSGACGMDKSASLLPKFESAAAVLKDVEKRVGALEIPNGRRKKRVRSPIPGKGIEAKVLLLENRIDHVASATYTNFRILDGKVEKLSSGVQTALDGAAATENKCTALGEEVVRVFRMIITARKPKEQPEKKSGINNSPGPRKRPQRWDNSGPGATQSRCICCNNGNRWTAPGELGPRNPKCPLHGAENKSRGGEVRKINVRLGHEMCAVRSESPIRCTIQTAPPGKEADGDSPVQCVIRTSSPVKHINQSALGGLLQMLESEATQAGSDGSGSPQDACEEDSTQEEQANFRLESSRIQLNVRG